MLEYFSWCHMASDVHWVLLLSTHCKILCKSKTPISPTRSISSWNRSNLWRVKQNHDAWAKVQMPQMRKWHYTKLGLSLQACHYFFAAAAADFGFLLCINYNSRRRGFKEDLLSIVAISERDKKRKCERIMNCWLKQLWNGQNSASRAHSTESGVVMPTSSTWPLSVSENAIRKT